MLFSLIKKHGIIRLGILSNVYIDKTNILSATLFAMEKAIKRLPIETKDVIIDGNKCPSYKRENMRITSLVKADNLVPEVSAASIVAKVVRDRIMCRIDTQFPDYCFSRHKGYGTSFHINKIALLGRSSKHRVSFNISHQLVLF